MRKLMWFALGFGCACALCGYLFAQWILYLGVVTAILSFVCLLFLREKKAFRIIGAVLLGVYVGIGWFSAYDQWILGNPRSLDGQIVKATMTVLDAGFETDYGTASDMELILNGKTYRVRTYLDGDVYLWPGDTVIGEFQLNTASDHLRGNNICLTAVQRSDVHLTSSMQMPLRHYPAVWRARLLQRIDLLFSEDTAGFAKALLLGERADIDYETNNAFRISGISHIIAVSGLHVSILVALLYFLTGRNRFLSGILGIPCLLLFAAMVGFTPSITRACIMQCMMLIALMVNREYDSPTALSFAGLSILIGNPYAILSVSFQLSFGCMIGIFLFSEKIHRYLLERLGGGTKFVVKLKKWFAASVSITLGANIVTTPLVAYYFGAISLVGVLTNLLTLWVVSIIFYGILFACALSLITFSMGSAVAWGVSFLIRYVIRIAKLLSSIPLAAVYTESVYILIWLVACYLLLGTFLLLRKRSVSLLIGCIAAMLALSLALSWVEPRLDDTRVTVLDVGQGQAVLLQSEGRTYLVDCGSTDPERAADKTTDYLLSMGVFRLDGIIVTHYDTDHVGGVPLLLTRIDADAVYLPKAGAEEEVASQVIAALDTVLWVEDDLCWTFGEASIQLFAPETLEFGNESSVCILFRRENCDILITGDRSREGELRLLQRTQLPELELLIAGHHGSKNATSDSLLYKTSPEYVFISAGENNRYGHPSEEVLERLERHGCTVYRTDRHGDLIFRR